MGRTTNTSGKDKKTTTAKKRLPAKPKFKVVEGTEIEVPVRLPRPTKGRNLTDKSKIKIAKYVCEVYSTDKFTLDNTLAYFGIKSHVTFHTWRKQIDEINDMYQNAVAIKEKIYFENLKHRARTGLEKKVDGHVVTLKTVKHRSPTIKEAKENTGIVLMIETQEREVYVPPSDQAIIFALGNHDGGNFNKNPDPPREATKSQNEYDHWTEDQLDEEIKRLEDDGY